MKLIPLIFCVIGCNIIYAQNEPYFLKDECAFFQYLDSLEKNNYENEKYKQLKSNEYLSRKLLIKIEEYLEVCDSYDIVPIYFDSSKNDFACDFYVSEFENAYFKDNKSYHESRESVQIIRTINVRKLLLDLSGITEDNSDNFEKNIAEFTSPLPLEYLAKELDSIYCDSVPIKSLAILPKITIEKNQKLLNDRINILDHKLYVFYESNNSKSNFLKGIEAYHENDVFLFFTGMNQDRELTGGFKVVFITDYFKWRWLNLFSLVPNLSNSNKLLTYQSIAIGGRGYTPYIRYRNNFALADSMHTYDRPFSSNMYLERSKYRTWANGLLRHNGSFQIGSIGISQGRKIQAQLHEDVIHESQFVHGWDKQIGDGGRLFLQQTHKIEFLLISKSNRFPSVFKPYNVYVEKSPNYCGANLIGHLELNVGTLITSAGVGIRFSTLDFLKQSGNNMVSIKPGSKFDFGWKLDFGISYQYVVHNSMLQGLGVYKPFPLDAYDVVNPDFYVLSDIENNMFFFDWGINLRWRKSTFFFRQVYHTLEYNSGLDNIDYQSSEFTSVIDPADVEFYNNQIVQEQSDFVNRKLLGRTFYGYGTIGMSWIID